MADTISLDLRRRVVDAYDSGLTASYEATAEMFGVGIATVSRLLRRKRETGDVLPKERGGDRRRELDLVWLEEHARANPDARLVDRIAAWQQHNGCRTSIGAMWRALDLIGWTHKKRLQSRSSVTGRRSRRSATISSPNNRSSTPAD
jgi:transposase